ncbi:MAG: hypothetical protein M3Q75_01405 [Gemmatimonadota bacterium]|nr:hypothetical protein [Gemmatimonadota bacterium]
MLPNAATFLGATPVQFGQLAPSLGSLTSSFSALDVSLVRHIVSGMVRPR